MPIDYSEVKEIQRVQAIRKYLKSQKMNNLGELIKAEDKYIYSTQKGVKRCFMVFDEATAYYVWLNGNRHIQKNMALKLGYYIVELKEENEE